MLLQQRSFTSYTWEIAVAVSRYARQVMQLFAMAFLKNKSK